MEINKHIPTHILIYEWAIFLFIEYPATYFCANLSFSQFERKMKRIKNEYTVFWGNDGLRRHNKER